MESASYREIFGRQKRCPKPCNGLSGSREVCRKPCRECVGSMETACNTNRDLRGSVDMPCNIGFAISVRGRNMSNSICMEQVL